MVYRFVDLDYGYSPHCKEWNALRRPTGTMDAKLASPYLWRVVQVDCLSMHQNVLRLH
jgi:hypothetical protein